MINSYMWQNHTQVKLSTKEYSCPIRGDYQTGPYFYKIGWQKKNKTKRENKALPNETNSNYSSDSMNYMILKTQQNKITNKFNIKYTKSSKKITTTKHGLLEVNTITNQGIPINKEIENETNTSTAYKSLPLPQSETVQILLSNKQMKMKQKKEMN